MPKRLIGIILIFTGIVAFHLFGTQPETRAVWQNSIDAKVYSEPVAVGDNFVFLAGDKGNREYRFVQINSQGKITAESVKFSVLPYPPLAFDGIIVAGDHAKMVRGFSVPGLNLEWETGTISLFSTGPIKAGADRLLVQSDRNLLFCLESKTGKPVWDKTFTESLVNYNADKIVVCIHGHADLKNPVWKASGLDPADGQVLWTLEQRVSNERPLFVQGICILSTPEGQIMMVDQQTGQVLYQHPVDGLKAVEILDDILLMLASGGSRLVCMSLMNGSSWTTTTQSGFTGAAKYGSRLLVADKKHLRCLDAATGALLWNRNLEDVYNAFPFRNGIYLTHKDSFFARETFGSYIETGSPESLWLAYDRSIFLKPLATGYGDLLVAYSGNFRMMPKVKSASVDTPAFDPTENINFWKTTTASDSVATSPAAPPKNEAPSPTPSNIEEDTGWGKQD
jgi:outer membrane protein assembly factor BamB